MLQWNHDVTYTSRKVTNYLTNKHLFTNQLPTNQTQSISHQMLHIKGLGPDDFPAHTLHSFFFFLFMLLAETHWACPEKKKKSSTCGAAINFEKFITSSNSKIVKRSIRLESSRSLCLSLRNII